MPWYSKMYFNEKDCLPKTGNGKAIILSTRAAFYLSASVFQPESNATNQQIVISSYEVLFSVYFWIKEILLHHVEIFRQTGLIKNCHKFNNQLYQFSKSSILGLKNSTTANCGRCTMKTDVMILMVQYSKNIPAAIELICLQNMLWIHWNCIVNMSYA